MVPEKLLATLGTVILFGVGLATAALADPPPTTTESTTTTTAPAPPAPTTSTTASTTTSTTTDTTTTAPLATTTPATTTTAVTPPPSATTRPLVIHPGATVRDEPTHARQTRPRHKKHRRRVSRPLAVTPPLGQSGYVFPIVGTAGYGDSYGGFRADVHGKWHHGDDLFAPLGAPVVAVADGTVNRVGWRRIGGWRLWVRDTHANYFYYAHLSGYAPSIFHSRRVRAGQVIGFVGNTGDAFDGAPHVHFEIHPHQLLRLRYDGAVDPTTYLDSWRRVQTAGAPMPVHPRLPLQPAARAQARVVFRRLLAVRHQVDQSAAAFDQQIDRPEGAAIVPAWPRLLAVRAEPATAAAAANEGGSLLTLPLLVGLLSIAVFVAVPVLAATALGRVFRRKTSEP